MREWISAAWAWQFGSESTMYRRTLVALLAVDLVFFLAIVRTSANVPEACAILIATAAAGGFLGLLFGAPRVQRSLIADKEGSRVDDSSGEIRLNSNFQAISDWLTMGITVLTLASLGTLTEQGKHLAQSLTGAGAFAGWPANAVLILLVGAAVLGFAHTFIWANTELVTGLREQERLHAERAKTRAARLDRNAFEQQAQFAAQQWGWFMGQTLDLAEQRKREGQGAMATFGFSDEVWNSDPVHTDPPFAGRPADDGAVRLLLRSEPQQSAQGLRYALVTATLEGSGEAIPAGTVVTFHLHPSYGVPGVADSRKPFEVNVSADSAGRAQLMFPVADPFWLGASVVLDGELHRVRAEIPAF